MAISSMAKIRTSAGIGLAVLSFQEVLVDLMDGFQVQSQMSGHFLDGQHQTFL